MSENIENKVVDNDEVKEVVVDPIAPIDTVDPTAPIDTVDPTAPVVVLVDSVTHALSELSKEDLVALLKEALMVQAKQEVTVKLPNAGGIPKNHQDQAPDPNRKYVLRSKVLNCSYGKVPQQQRDLAAILAAYLTVGIEYSEKEVFDLLNENRGKFSSLAHSRQSVTYLFKYYRGLEKDGKYFGFVLRGFLTHN